MKIWKKKKKRPNLIIKGIKENRDENCVEIIKALLKNRLEIKDKIPIKRAFRVGKGKICTFIAVLAKPSDKAKIYTNAPKLQEDKENKCKIADQLPARLNEIQVKNRNMVWKNKQSVATKLELSLKKRKLYIEGKPYSSKIKVPVLAIILHSPLTFM